MTSQANHNGFLKDENHGGCAKKSQPFFGYKYKHAEDTAGFMDKAFDILFEETLRKYGDLTTNGD